LPIVFILLRVKLGSEIEDLWMGTINGASGYFNLGGAGNYGRNAANKVANTPLDKLQDATVGYTPKDKPTRMDALGYAEQDIRVADINKDGALDIRETRSYFGVDPNKSDKTADTMFTTIDTDGNGKIDVQEDAAYVMYQDHSAPLLNKTIDADQKAGLISKKDADKMKADLKKIAPKSTKADGQITADERKFADKSIMANPEMAKQTLQGFKDSILKEPYQQYLQQQQGQNPQDPTTGGQDPNTGSGCNNNPQTPGTGSGDNQQMQLFSQFLDLAGKMLQLLSSSLSNSSSTQTPQQSQQSQQLQV
jgi:hypothetical protein